MQRTLFEAIRTVIRKYYVIVDPYWEEILVATMIANFIIKMDAVWLMNLAPSSGGKSAMLAPFVHIKPDSIKLLDMMTPNTLLSGKTGKGGKDVSLLNQMGRLAMIILSDSTTIIDPKNLDTKEILAQFRQLYDGELHKHTGNGGVSWKGKMGMIAAGTPSMYHVLELFRAQGERFLYYNPKMPDKETVMRKISGRKISSKEIAEEIGAELKKYFTDLTEWLNDDNKLEKIMDNYKLNDTQYNRFSFACQFLVKAKTTVHVDWRGRVDQMPDTAEPYRDFNMLQILMRAFLIMDCYEANDPTLLLQDRSVQISEIMSYSSLNREKRKILETLSKSNAPMTAKAIGSSNGLAISEEPLQNYLISLLAVQLIIKTDGGNLQGIKWTINPDYRDYILRISELLGDDAPISEEERKFTDAIFQEQKTVKEQLALKGRNPMVKQHTTTEFVQAVGELDADDIAEINKTF